MDDQEMVQETVPPTDNAGEGAPQMDYAGDNA